MKNDLDALNNYLFEELERLNDDEELESDLETVNRSDLKKLNLKKELMKELKKYK